MNPSVRERFIFDGDQVQSGKKWNLGQHTQGLLDNHYEFGLYPENNENTFFNVFYFNRGGKFKLAF